MDREFLVKHPDMRLTCLAINGAPRRRIDWVEPPAPGEWDLTNAEKVGDDD